MDERTKARRSLLYDANTRDCICEKLRSIYDSVHDILEGEQRELLTELLVDAFIMAKKMDNRLTYYRHTYNDNTGTGGRLPALAGTFRKKVMRRNRV